METVKIAPLGIKPKYIWDSMRVSDILDAMERFADAQKPIPVEWVTELKGLLVKEEQNNEHRLGKYSMDT